LLLRQAREQGFDAQFMAPEAAASMDLVTIVGPLVEGLLVTFPADFTKLAQNADIVAAFRAAKRDPEGAFQMSSYAAVQVLVESIRAVGEDPDKVADYMHANSFDTAIGQMEFDAKGDLKDFEFAVLRWDREGNKMPL